MEQFSTPEQHNSHENPPPDLATLMQTDLLARHPDWIEKNAEDFRALITNYPQILEDYEQDPKEAIKKIEKFYYGASEGEQESADNDLTTSSH